MDKKLFAIRASNYFIIGHVFMLCLFFGACGPTEPSNSAEKDDPNSTSENGREITESDISDEDMFQGDAEFLRKLFSASDCHKKGFLPPDPTGPITCSTALHALHAFITTYRNVGELNYEPIKIKEHGALGTLFSNMAGTNYGLVFHYGYDTLSGNLVYLLSKGKLDKSEDPKGKVSYCPFSASDGTGGSGNHYLLLKSSTTQAFERIDEANFKKYKDIYLNEMQILVEGNWLNLDRDNHPKLVYHTPKQLMHFYNKYFSFPDAQLYIGHGSLDTDSKDRAYHIPCFIFGNDTAFFELDNSIDNQEDSSSRYDKKALDIGRLCPPHCRDPLTPCQ